MQKSGHYTSGFGHEKEDSDISHGLPRDPDISQASSYGSARSVSLSQTTLRSTNSFRVKAQEFAAGFVTCFVPHRHATCEGAEHEDGLRDVSDFSASSRTRGNGLEIGQRLNIAIDVAHAVAYLHTDIKASNILLTDKLRAKVADFGFARLAAEDPEATHVSTQIKGTAGYLDPEYLRTYQLTEKSDVYSFGVLLVEIVTGRRPIERNRDNRERVTTRWVRTRPAGDTEVQGRGRGGGDGPAVAAEPSGGGRDGEGAGAGGAVHGEGKEVAAVDEGVRGGAVGDQEGLPEHAAVVVDDDTMMDVDAHQVFDTIAITGEARCHLSYGK
ncbi:hypothetical protein GW17_00025953 [Ensete ventricosum]|nr:hypothetical protein GW17_00025953 [Ensete ventricosum]